ncbi:MAG: substrate-binding domain-containing protein [Halolamina sp.]
MVDSGSADGSDSESVSRRRFVQAASAAGVTTGLAGCVYGGSDSGSGGTVTWGFDPTAAQEAGEDIKQAFYDAGLSKDIDIEFSTGGAETGSRRDSYNTLLNAGETDPDMFMMDNGWTNIFIARQQLANLSEMLPSDAISTVNEEYFNGFTATARGGSGDLFGVPLFPDFPTMQYRKDWAEEAGYNPESDNWATEPMTWQEFSQVTKDIKEQQSSKYGYTFQFDIYEGLSCCDFNEFITSWGGAYFGGRENLFGPIGDRPVTVDTEPVKNALRMIRTFVHGQDDPESLDGYAGQIAPSEVLSMTEESSRKPMLNGDAVMHRNWPYALSLNGASDALGEDYGAMPIPYAVSEGEAMAQGTGGTASALGGWHMTVNPNTENEEAVKEVISTHVNSDQLKLDILEIYGWLPTKPELFNSSRAQEVEPVGRYMDTLKVAGENVIARPVTAVWSSQSSAIAQEANAAAAQKKSPSEGMGDLESKLQEIENGYEG